QVVDTRARKELANLQVNLNAEVKNETLPADPTKSLDKVFGNDLVAIDATVDGKVFLIVSRGGNFVFRATVDASGKLALGSPVVRTPDGTPAQPLISKPIRDVTPLESRGKASKNASSGCASCHPDGLTDNVTWSFPDGPRQSLPLDAFFSKDNPVDQRISNWS